MLLIRRLPQAWLGLLLCGLLASGCSPSEQPPTLQLEQARVMQPLPGKSITSGYFDLHNRLDRPVELVGASSAATSSIEMHEILRDGDKVRMRRLTSVTIPPGATQKFEKGAKHLMLFGVSELPAELKITLKFADGSETLQRI